MRFLSTMLLAGATALGPISPGAPPGEYLETIKVADDIYVFKPKIDWAHGNAVAIISADGVFFIDTFLQFNYAEEAIRRLGQITKQPVRYVFNTHSHNDHVSGNGVFKRVFPGCLIIAQDAAVAGMNARVKAKVEGEADFIRQSLAQADSEVKAGKTPGGTPLVGSMKTYWDLSLREAIEYQQQYRPEKYYPPDITFGDSLTMRWGNQTLTMVHMTEKAHSTADAILWIPEKRLVVAGDIVVAPTPYYNLPGITKAVRHLIDMNPAIVIPGHGPVQHTLDYMLLLERAFSTYQHAADSVATHGVPKKQAYETIAFPEIDRAFTGDDDMKKWTYRAFFTNNVIAKAYEAAAAAKP